MSKVETILNQLKVLKSSIQTSIKYEDSKGNFDKCKLLQDDLIKVMVAIYALEDLRTIHDNRAMSGSENQ